MMLELLKKETTGTYTLNGGLTHSTSGSNCLDLFFRADTMRNVSSKEIAAIVRRAFAEDPVRTIKIVFFARDVRGGLGERRFSRIAMQTLAKDAPEAVRRNLAHVAEYGRYDDLCALLHTPCEQDAVALIRERLDADRKAMAEGGQVSLLAKWLPSVNASAKETCAAGRCLASRLDMTERAYRKCLSALRSYSDVLENRLRTADYTFDYRKQPSGAMLKYRKAFLRNDGERYQSYLDAVDRGEAVLHAGTLYPYEIVRQCLNQPSAEERQALDLTWRNLPAYGESQENAIAVIDGSGSMTCCYRSNVRPIDAALSLGMYFAEHNKGAFANHFITFSMHPQLIEIKGDDIVAKAQYCETFDECANTDLEAVFRLILDTAVKNRVPQSELPSKLFIISDMEFDGCIEGGNSQPLYDTMRQMYADAGYTLPQVVFWNVNSFQSNLPVTMGTAGTALVSGFSPSLFDLVMSGELAPELIMDRAIFCERYAKVG